MKIWRHCSTKSENMIIIHLWKGLEHCIDQMTSS